MAYELNKKRSSFIYRLKIKIARMIVSTFPLNAVRVRGLKACGFLIGEKVYISNGVFMTMPNTKSDCMLEIGNRVLVAPRVTFLLANDAEWSRLGKFYPPIEGTIRIKDDCWIGTGATILPNITVGEMSIVGANSVVTHDVPPYTVVAGVPARKIKEIAAA